MVVKLRTGSSIDALTVTLGTGMFCSILPVGAAGGKPCTAGDTEAVILGALPVICSLAGVLGPPFPPL